METASGSPAVISTLWYAGERSGRELIYPREQALRIAKATNAAVLTTKASTTKAVDVKSGDLARVSPSGQDTEFAENSATNEPAGRLQRDTPVAETPVATSGQSPAPVGRTTPARSSLPKTASNTPMLLMLGLGFLAAAFAVRLSRAA